MQEEQEQEIHLRDYLKVIVKRRYSILTVSLLIIVVASIGIFSKTPVYRATTRILIDKESANIVNLRDPYYEGYYSEEYYNTQMELIQSTAVAYKVVKNLNLDKPTETPQPTGKTGGGVLSGFWDLFGFNNKGKKAEAKLDDVGLALAKMVQGGLSVEPIKNSRLVNLSYVHADPVLAAKFANAYADAYLDQVLEIKMGTTRHAVDWMTKKLDEQKIRMEESQKALQEYIKNKDFLTIGDKEAVTSPKIQSLSSQLMAAETRRRETEVLYNQVKALSDNPRDAMTMPGMTEDPVIQSLRDEEIKAEKQLMELSKKYGDRHPLIIKAKGDIRSLREKMDSEIKRVIASRKNEYELAKANEANLRVLFERGKGEAQSLTAKSMQFDVLKHEVEMNEQIYEALLKRVKETTLVEEVKSFNIYVLDKAEIPKSPINPNSFKNFLLAIMLGLSGGVGLAFFLEYLDNTFKGPEDIEEKLALPLLGIVPRIKKADAQDRPIESLVLTDPKSAVGESYKALRTSVLLSSGDPVKSFVVTSSVENEGKTTTAINLAISFAQLEKKVLLVDADLRKPRAHSILGLDNSIGFSSYLSRQTVHENIRETGMPNFSFLSAGPLPPNPSELLSSRRMKDFLEIVTNSFDLVVFDTPPVITVADTLILSAQVDGTLMVVKSGSTTFDVARRGLKLLKDANIKILGGVLNSMDTEKEGYRYLYPYYYQYSHGKKKTV